MEPYIIFRTGFNTVFQANNFSIQNSLSILTFVRIKVITVKQSKINKMNFFRSLKFIFGYFIL